MRYAIIGLAVSVLASTAPAAGNAQTKDPAAKQPAAKEKVYCMKHEITGSRMPRTKCLTKAEWARAGVDLDDPSNK